MLFIKTDKYDWMSPRSPLRRKNDEFYYEFKRIERLVERAQSNATGKHPCLAHHLFSFSSTFFLFTYQTTFTNAADEDSVEITQAIRHNKRRLRILDTSFHFVPVDIADRRCNWCSVRILDFRQKYILQSAVMDVKGVGRLPTLYDLDHEGKPLCLHCGKCFGMLCKVAAPSDRLLTSSHYMNSC